jgi:glycosyltransferase involved in cell wall biosynthesis
MNSTAKTTPFLSAIVPARNEEASIASCLESLAQQPEIAEILVVDDQSTDRTAQIVRELTLKFPHLRLLQTTDLPSGWVGKNHAVWLGASEAKGDWLLFTDADVLHGPNSAAKALQLACGTVTPDCALGVSSAAQLVSFSPEQITETWYEKALIPVVYCRLAKKFSFDRVNDPQNPAAAANGQFLLISREAYNAVGGHASIAGEVLEDVALAKLVKQARYPIWFGSGKGIVRVRMYRTFSAMWEGWKKNLYSLMGGHPSNLVSEIAYATAPLLLLALLVALPWGMAHDWQSLTFRAAIALGFWHWLYTRELAHNQFPIKLFWYGILGKFLYAAVLWASFLNHRKGLLAWKGREYPVGTSGASKR